MAIAATRSQHDASGAAMIHLGDIGPARIRHVHVGVLLKEKREHRRLLSGNHGLQLCFAKHHQGSVLRRPYVVNC